MSLYNIKMGKSLAVEFCSLWSDYDHTAEVSAGEVIMEIMNIGGLVNLYFIV